MNIFIFPPSPANAMNGGVGKFWQDPKSQWMMDTLLTFFSLGQPNIDIFQYFNVETLIGVGDVCFFLTMRCFPILNDAMF